MEDSDGFTDSDDSQGSGDDDVESSANLSEDEPEGLKGKKKKERNDLIKREWSVKQTRKSRRYIDG